MRYAAMFHHFYDDIKHPKGQGAISRDEFRLILDWLETKYSILSPEKFYYKLTHQTLTATDVCLTFDDALKSQFDIALPELELRNLKAFFFVYSSAFSESPDPLEFYRDFRNTYFESVDDFYGFYFQNIKEYHNDSYKKFHTNYNEDYLSCFPFYTENDKKFRFMRDQVLGASQYNMIMDELLSQKGYSKEKRLNHLFMSVNDLKQISDLGHTVGLHSHSHPTMMAKLPADTQLDGYTKNKEFLVSVTNNKIWSMSHPCGSYSDTTLSILKRLDIKIGFRSSLSPLTIKSNLEIPREDHANLIKLIKGTTK